MYINQNYNENTEYIYELVEKSQNLKTQEWIDNVVFSPLWWLAIFLSIVPWFFWIWFHNKKSRYRLLFVGLTVCIMASFLDFLGTQLGLWLYYYEVFPWLPPYAPWDLTLLPVMIMVLIEYKPNKSPIVKALIFSTLAAFIGEPLFIYLGLYKEINWSMFYSFPIYFLIYLVAYWFSKRRDFDTY